MLKFFAEKNVSSFCATHIFFSKNIRILYIESAKTVNEMTLNEHVKLTTLWTTGPRFAHQSATSILIKLKKGKRKDQGCHNHKPQPFPDPKRKRKPTNPNKYKSKKRTKSTKISSLFPKQGNRNTKRTEKHKNKMTHGKTYNKSPRRINDKATKSKTNTGTTALEQVNRVNHRGFKALLQLANFTLGPDATLNT